MLKKITVIISALSLSLLLSNCSVGQLNTVNTITQNTKELQNATINLSSFDSKDIDEVQVDGKKLSVQDYSGSDNKLNLSNLEPGKHIVQFKHKKYGYTDVPIEVRSGQENNFQLNAIISNDQINNWELGIDANKDGIIDNNSFLSKQIDNYVVVREFSGTTNYLPKQTFAEDYRGAKIFPPPPDFPVPDPNNPGTGFANEPGKEQSSVFMPKSPNVNGQFLAGHITITPGFRMGEPRQDILNLSKVYIPYPQNLSSDKIVAIFINDHLLPEADYAKNNDSLIFNGEVFKGINNFLKVYLIDETGQGVLLSINPKQPIFNIIGNNTQNQVNDVPSKKEIFVVAEDLNYTTENNVTLDLQKIEQLRKDKQLGNKVPPDGMPFQLRNNKRRPPDDKVIQVPLGKVDSNGNVTDVSAIKYVQIDENGEIVDFSDKVPTEDEQND